MNDLIPRIPVGATIDVAVDWLTVHLKEFFDGTSAALALLVGNFEEMLTFPAPIATASILALLAWRIRGAGFGAFSLLALLLVQGMGLWSEAMSTLALVLVASAAAVLVGVPLGIASARRQEVSTLVRPVLDLMQTMPSFVYLIPAIIFFGIGKVPGVVATVVFAMPPSVRLTELGLRQVDREVVEAGEAFGASPRQILTRVQIPLALPTIMAGVNQVIMLALSMVVISGIVGAGGLGAVVFRGVTRLDVGLGFEGGLAVVILAILLDRMTATFAERSAAKG